MKRPLLVLLLVVVASFLIFAFAVSQGQEGKAPTDTTKMEAAKADTTKADTTEVVFKYIGNTKCKMCHNSPAKGAMWDVWSKTKHATAFATLANEESKKIAKEKGIADPQKDAKCLICHVD
jgi:hypothetical protein